MTPPYFRLRNTGTFMTARFTLKAFALILLPLLSAPLATPLAAAPAPSGKFSATYGTEPVKEEPVKPDSLEQLRASTLSLWPRFRDTSQQYYTYVRAAADMRAYFHSCTRNDLTPHMNTVNRLAVKYLETIVTAHYEENEWAAIHAMTPKEKAAILTDFANDVLAFEYGLSLAAFEARKTASGKTPLAYCQGIAREYQANYIPLLATARRELNEK
ncbi:hypothetical protein [Kordiimonas marina]|uniref:hypothetical protein n=1 Tax=Kordiimonas marina TaxID=2872312 RepID=UPI001FF5F69E|nr:hypothetical protein [Kordiimonas marina]MCJ9427848.1 hypothetical protein [Kordiimonas marina]